jgi:hypothetical protein
VEFTDKWHNTVEGVVVNRNVYPASPAFDTVTIYSRPEQNPYGKPWDYGVSVSNVTVTHRPQDPEAVVAKAAQEKREYLAENFDVWRERFERNPQMRVFF